MFGGGMIGQALGLTRGTTVAPQNVPSAPMNHGSSTTAQSFGQAVASQVNTVGYQFTPCLPLNTTVAQKVQNNKQTDFSSFLCCITGVDQFQQFCVQELMMNDRKLVRQGNVQPPQGNLNQISAGMGGQMQQTGAQTTLGGGGIFGAGQGAGQTQAPTQGGGLFGVGGGAVGGGMFGGGQVPTAQTATGGGGLFGQGGATTTPAVGGGGLFGGQPAATGGMFGGGATTTQAPATGGGLFGATQPQTGGGLFGGAAQAPVQQGGLFGGAGTGLQTGQATGGMFGATNPTQGGGLLGATQTGGGLFGATTQPSTTLGLGTGGLGGGLFGGAGTTTTTAQTGGLFGGQQQGGLFGATQQAVGGGMFGQQQQPATAASLFGQPQPQQTGLGGPLNTQSELLNEINRIEQAKQFKLSQEKQKEGNKNNKFASNNNHLNHINYLKSQQEKRNIYQQYTVGNKNPTKFIEAPYNVKLNVNWENIKRNEWQILQRSQDIKNQTYINMGGEQRLFSQPNSSSYNNSLFYNQLRQLERASYQYTSKSLAEKEEEYNKEQLEAFKSTSFYQNMEPGSFMSERQDLLNKQNDSQDDNTKEKTLSEYYQLSLRKSINQFETTVTIRLREGTDPIVIPLLVKSQYTVSYLLTLTFNYIEDNFFIDPLQLDIYKSNFVLYQPLEIKHIVQVRKDSLISELETEFQGKIGYFEVVYLNPEDAEDIEIQEEMFDEEEDDFEDINQDFSYLPIIPEGYESEPNLKELITKSPQQLEKFKNFKIRNQFAEVCFEGEINLIRLDFSKDLLITENEVAIYPYKPENEPSVPPGYGINVQATIKRFNASKLLLLPNEKFDIQKIERRIRNLASQNNMQIVEPYNQKTDSFTVRLLHFIF